jgi:two-component system, LytTR family, response regulator
MRVLMVDDEEPARAKLRRMAAGEPDVEVAGEAGSGQEAVRAIRELRPDVVFLDIQMPGLNGFEVIEAVGPAHMPCVVFVTAFDEHALRAFEAEAFDYLLKPVTPDRFRRMMERLRRWLPGPRDPALAARLDRLLESLRPARPVVSRLMVEDGDRTVFLVVERIDWIDAAKNYVEVHAGTRTYLLRSSIGALQERLDPATFVRINRSQIVRLDAVKEMHPWFHGEFKVVLKDGTELMWTRRYRRDVDGVFGKARD